MRQTVTDFSFTDFSLGSFGYNSTISIVTVLLVIYFLKMAFSLVLVHAIVKKNIDFIEFYLWYAPMILLLQSLVTMKEVGFVNSFYGSVQLLEFGFSIYFWTWLLSYYNSLCVGKFELPVIDLELDTK